MAYRILFAEPESRLVHATSRCGPATGRHNFACLEDAVRAGYLPCPSCMTVFEN